MNNIKSRRSTVKGVKGRPKKTKKGIQFAVYIYRILKHIHKDIGMSNKAMAIMNSMVQDVFERISTETSQLVAFTKRSTITANDVLTATRLLLPGELSKHATSEGTKAVKNYGQSVKGSE
ncbi:hypothetical protein L596_027355 [Steinernema carpocapsae]|uniref:Core Histone H2A/H2B/H3 domain-containing protein n=1 Tax=Steinernema carpocapsae TaxID=34508 RepID=A0A4U5M441_STECR|nr:hypothetical protein L596_027355 [Steinernema carpocapsae]